MAEVGEYSYAGFEMDRFQECLVESCYIFTIHDSAGDGIWVDDGYSISVDEQTIRSGGGFGYSETTLFGKNCSTSSPLPTTSSPSSAPTISPIPSSSPMSPTQFPTSTPLPTATPWIQVANIDGPGWGDSFGGSVSFSDDGTRLVVGAPGYDYDGYLRRGLVRVFEMDQGGNWTQLGQDLLGDAVYEYFGEVVTISGDGERVAVRGSNNEEWIGIVKVFEYENGSWKLLGSPMLGEAYDFFGRAISLSGDGNYVAVGAPNSQSENGDDSGQVRVFEFVANMWTQLGEDIDGEEVGDLSGDAGQVSLSGDGLTVAIGTRFNNGDGQHGYVRIYTYQNDGWIQIGQVLYGEAEGDASGLVSLSANGAVVAIGAPGNDGTNGVNSGHVRVYGYEEGTNTWSQLGDDIDGEAAHDYSGVLVSLSSDGKVVAIHQAQSNGSGRIRIFRFDSNAWVQIGANIKVEAPDNQSGYVGALSLSGDGGRVSIGEPLSDPNGESSGRVRIFYSPVV